VLGTRSGSVGGLKTMEQAVALIHRTKEAPAAEKGGHFDEFLRLIRCALSSRP